MKVAVTYEKETRNVFQHFGKTQYFKIYQIEDGKILSSQVIDNGAKMPQFGIGTFNLGTDEVVYNSVLTALREGYRHIDTAHAYRAERGVGRAVKQFCEESGLPRSEIWVTSKVWPTEYGEGVTLPAIDRMLDDFMAKDGTEIKA